MPIAGLNVMDMLRYQLKLKQLEIDALLEVTTAINLNEPASRLFELFDTLLSEQLGVDHYLLFFNQNTWQVKASQGYDLHHIFINVERDLLHFKQLVILSDLGNSRPDILKDFDLIIPVFHKQKPLAFLLMSTPMLKSYEPLEEKIKLVQTVVNIISVAIENKKLFKKEKEQEALKRELEVAAQVQTMLIPDKLPKNNEFEMAAIYLPHINVGGDYYDFMELGNDEFSFCIADISGKGIAAALLMANFQAQLRELVKTNHTSIDILIQKLNAGVLLSTRGEKFITMFLGIYNRKTRILRYVNAGHNPPVLVTKNNSQLLETGCTILGMFENLPNIQSGEVKVEDDTTILCYTDGLTDLVNENNQVFSLKGLTAFLKHDYNRSAEKITHELIEIITNYKEANDLVDDITILAVKIFGK
ncbi:MAG: PP2C family protein-serine/threonine phosphatase [Chitinophagales bacterium]|nr:PP2C family protein-serine/threonine phosphatase [Chitinophagales bacterium]